MGSRVKFKANGHSCEGYVAGKGPAVVVIQEWWGLVKHIEEVVDRFASEGFLAIAPDLYHGKSTESPGEAERLKMELDVARADREIAGAGEYLLTRPDCTSKKYGVVGFCMGGQLALFAATLDPSIGACVNFYGIHPNVKPDYRKLSGPVLGLYAEKDGFVTPDVARGVDKAIKDAGKSSEIHIYPGVDHGFFNDDRPDVHDKPASADAWKRTLALFRQHLK